MEVKDPGLADAVVGAANANAQARTPSSPLAITRADYSNLRQRVAANYDWRDADLRVRVRGVRGPLRGADGERAGCRLPELRLGANAAAALDRLAARSPAARRRRALGRIAPAGAGIGAPGAAGRGEEAAGGGGEAVSASAEERRQCLVELYEEVKDCTKCPLHETRTKAVFGAGNADADLMFVGEAPGAEEDRSGLPFVGRAGQLLNQMLEEIGLARDAVCTANVLKPRPPGYRDPQPEEIAACEPYLVEQVRLIEQRVVCTLGNFATKLLSGSQTGITKVRGTPQVHELGGRTVFLLPLFHPAAALRTPAVKETLRGDFATLPGLLAMEPPDAEPEEEELEEQPAPEPEPSADQLDFFG